ncbi:ATP-binding cassette domain-containing protein [Bacillaceae bacterium Marseille-Q3522]|nr:ATP-binding cassette domain-containing protein [Bacillaceae bacterium Marseille-Q3522]
MAYLFKTQDLVFGDFIPYPDMELPQDKVTFITGESGFGKSTLLKMFNKVLPPSKGTLFYNGKNLAEYDSIRLRQEVSLISQEVFLFDTSIRNNFAEFYHYRGLKIPDDKKMLEFLSICCLGFPLEQDAATMSGGERQRLYLAIFLSFVPKVLMLDEPTSALDEKISFAVMENIIAFSKKHDIHLLVISHDKKLTDAFSENTITFSRRGEGIDGRG